MIWNFFIPADNDTYIDLDIKVYDRVKLVSTSGKDVDFADHTFVTNNFFHSLFRQCNVTPNGDNITQASEHGYYRSFLETLITYGTDVAATHLSNAYWYIDRGDMRPVDPSVETVTAMTKRGFILRRSSTSASREVQVFCRLHSDIFNVPL